MFVIIIGQMSEKTASKNEDLPNFCKISDHLYRGGQPTEAGIKQLAKLGIKTIISFRDADAKVARERKIVEANDMKFISMPLSNWFKSKDSDIKAILNEIRTAENQPVFIHCNRGADRTGTVMAVYRMEFDGWTAQQANKEAKQYGIGWWQIWMKDYINDYYKRMNAKNDSKP